MAEPTTVLVVDDYPDIATLLSVILERGGYRVLTAHSAAEASAMIEAEPVDLVITDIMMPRMTGVEMATELRRSRPDLPVLYMSAYIDPDERRWVVLSKPFAADEVLARVRDALGG